MQDLPPFGLIDILAVVLVLIGALRGLRVGLSGEIARLFSALAAIVLALYFYAPVARWTVGHTRLAGRPATLLAFAFTAGAALLVMLLLRKALANVIRLVVREDFDRSAGAVAGFVGSAVFVLLVFLLMHLLPEESYLHRKFNTESAIGALIAPYMPEVEDRSAAPPAPPD